MGRDIAEACAIGSLDRDVARLIDRLTSSLVHRLSSLVCVDFCSAASSRTGTLDTSQLESYFELVQVRQRAGRGQRRVTSPCASCGSRAATRLRFSQMNLCTSYTDEMDC